MIRKMAISVLLASGMVSAIYARDLNERWKKKTTTPNGDETTLVFSFKVDGKTPTGNVQGPTDDLPIAEDKVNRDELSFKARIDDTVIDH